MEQVANVKAKAMRWQLIGVSAIALVILLAVILWWPSTPTEKESAPTENATAPVVEQATAQQNQPQAQPFAQDSLMEFPFRFQRDSAIVPITGNQFVYMDEYGRPHILAVQYAPKSGELNLYMSPHMTKQAVMDSVAKIERLLLEQQQGSLTENLKSVLGE